MNQSILLQTPNNNLPYNTPSSPKDFDISKANIVVSEITNSSGIAKVNRMLIPEKGLLFVFNLNSKIKISLPLKNKEILLGRYESIMFYGTEHKMVNINCSKSDDINLCVIKVNKLADLGDFKEDFLQTNFNSEHTNTNWFTGIPNIKLSSFVQDLLTHNETFSGNYQLLLGYTNIIIGSKLAEYSEFINGPKKQVDLRNDEIARIHECINYIKENYAQQLDVDSLCLKAALTPQKLQTGFKVLYGNTVTSFIKNFRLQKAEELMRTTELNVSQIVYSIGFTSRSYFSKIFKEKYETSPNDYLKKFKYHVA